MKKVLIIEDEESIRSFLTINFKMQNFIVIEAGSGEEGLNKARVENPDIIILDVMLPGMNGFQVCDQLRNEFPNLGIIMSTAKGQDLDKIKGLECGADDYVVKPFNPLELILRARSLLRRMNDQEELVRGDLLKSGPFVLEVFSQKVFKHKEEISLTPKEYDLIKLFMENPGRAFSRNELLDIVWGYDFVGDTKIVDVNIRRLRIKIEDDVANSYYIETVWGTGYRWRKD
ncbi:response regulator transcription factor [Lederbergia lenta]|uniref:DNA-binding response regulator n=1 Tax=Lederbergia lenta TaxID=1467 RepID=A0A2X4VL67_LEDLE|nr:response regulator transcription factor [Lederbergia lenta]MCM3112680.1 response regulator transcription factor [Lederbergia lenta]MEC2323719.1 response regulator transcription factor [Lederbergia lenta]SQI51571.1 DNA-binding response regulator [Lederbergia lenta]